MLGKHDLLIGLSYSVLNLAQTLFSKIQANRLRNRRMKEPLQDATHLLVKKDKVEFIMRKVDELMDKNTFAPVGEETQQHHPPAKRAKQAKAPPG